MHEPVPHEAAAVDDLEDNVPRPGAVARDAERLALNAALA
jgi:hypothetical protein